ncbi:hypothetical protein H2198_009094 [Neophaeococcomyces mojaviensis]|uniref:Uncharacterized protein n=1 Tax=Neophaeococcomyces mojaviensis TaxID=3383035 RepID=A0ACC2ZVE2_9EURO|nr:hypothetical protein H2198_009094 [Knufia sp. JES_112]
MNLSKEQQRNNQDSEEDDIEEVSQNWRRKYARHSSQKDPATTESYQSQRVTLRPDTETIETTVIVVKPLMPDARQVSQAERSHFGSSLVDDMNVTHPGPERGGSHGISRLRRELGPATSPQSVITPSKSGGRAGGDRDVGRQATGSEQKVYTEENVPRHWHNAGESNTSKYILRLQVLGENQEVMKSTTAFVDFGAERALIPEPEARRLGWNGVTRLENRLLEKLLRFPIIQPDGRRMTFLGIFTINAVIPETGQAIECDLQVVPKEELKNIAVILDSALARKFGLCQG